VRASRRPGHPPETIFELSISGQAASVVYGDKRDAIEGRAGFAGRSEVAQT